MYSYKEKKIHFNALHNPDAAKYDLELLTAKQPHLPQLATYSRNPSRYANDILYLLLDIVSREEIRQFRRTKMEEKVKASKVKAVKAKAAENDALPTSSENENPPAIAVADKGNNDMTEELKQSLEEANERAEEAELRAEEAEEAQEAAEAREETEQLLEEEKKKEQTKPKSGKSKSMKNTRKSTGTTSSTRKFK